MDADDSFAVVDEVEDSFLLALVGNEVGGVVKENGIVLGKALFRENAVVVGEINGESTGLLSDLLERVVAERNRGVNETFATPEGENLAV